MAESYFVELISVSSDFVEGVEATLRWDGSGPVTIETDDEDFHEELASRLKGGIPALDGSRLVTAKDGLQFLEALQAAYAGSRMYATEVKRGG